MIDVDATLVAAHSEKEDTAGNYKGGYGYHPLLVFLDNTGEALAGMLRPGTAGSNTAADHAQVVDRAPAQIPDAYRHGTRILVRADRACCSKAWLAHLRSLRTVRDPDVEFSTGYTMGAALQEAIGRLPESAWTPAVDAARGPRDGTDVAEITGQLPDRRPTAGRLGCG